MTTVEIIQAYADVFGAGIGSMFCFLLFCHWAIGKQIRAALEFLRPR